MGRFYNIKGKKLVSVTTFLNIIGKPFLIPWAAKMEREGKLKDGPYAYQIYMGKAADFGQEVHHAIEKYVTTGKTSKVSKQCIQL